MCRRQFRAKLHSPCTGLIAKTNNEHDEPYYQYGEISGDGLWPITTIAMGLENEKDSKSHYA